jgi:hypothetical protein
MVKQLVTTSIIVIIYLCIFILLFSPSLYAGWLYLMSRYTKVRQRGMLRVAITTLALNLIVALLLFHLTFNYFLTYKTAEKDAEAVQAVEKAIVTQENFYSSYGRYYSVGPVRGPYQDDHGLTVEKDVILQVEPYWDAVSAKETYEAYALHVLGKELVMKNDEGKVEKAPPDSQQSAAIRSKLLNSVK